MPAGAEFTVTRSLPRGHVAAVAAMAHQLGFPALLGPPSRARDLVLALIISRVIRPASKLATAAWWPDATLGPDLVSPAQTRSTPRWTGWQSAKTEATLAAKHLGSDVNLSRMALFGVGDRPVLRAGRAGLLPRRQERLAADRIRHPHRPGRVHRHRRGHRHPVRADRAGAGRGPGHDHLRAYRRLA